MRLLRSKLIKYGILSCLIVKIIMIYFTYKARRSISIDGNDFMVDGTPLRVVSGSLHYFRLPAAYWRDRLRKLKAAGLNAASTYVEWSYHEPEERQYKFTGDRDIAKFIRIAAEEGLYVLLRVGPYICAERDLGGLPYWLLGKYPDIALRTTDEGFIHESTIWVGKLFEQVSSLLYENGGPIILVQVENEYGSYDSDEEYRIKMYVILHKHVGTKALLFTSDGVATIKNGAIPNTLTTVNFMPGTNMNAFGALREIMPLGPLMTSEFYTGWLTHWGEEFQTTNESIIIDTLGAILDDGANVNFYTFFGGTNFEYTAGANFETSYQPDITSYDYDSPLNEAGDPTFKYFKIRDKLKQYNLVDESIELPKPNPKGSYGTVYVSFTLNLLTTEGRSQLGKKYPDVKGSTLPTFEKLRQRGGLMLYETKMIQAKGLLRISQPRDIVYVYVDNEFKGVISRMHDLSSLFLQMKNDSMLSLLVEHQGRINYGNEIHDFKGILSPVTLYDKVLDGKWYITGYPLETFKVSPASNQAYRTRGPTFYEGYFTLPEGEEPLDTFIDTTGWGKGYIWINGKNLGRYWPTVGPQITLYVPGVWLKPAPEANHLQILELDKPAAMLAMTFIEHPILNRTGSASKWIEDMEVSLMKNNKYVI